VFLIATSACTDQPISLATVFLRPTANMDGSPVDSGVNYEELRLPVADGRAVSIWHIKADHPKAVVVVIPGSDRNKSRYLPGVPIFVPSGYDLILMDYEGFGASTDAPLELERLIDDGFTVVDFARTLHPNVVAFGISIGAAATVRIAAETVPAAVPELGPRGTVRMAAEGTDGRLPSVSLMERASHPRLLLSRTSTRR
jgi:hypothetical protein